MKGPGLIPGLLKYYCMYKMHKNKRANCAFWSKCYFEKNKENAVDFCRYKGVYYPRLLNTATANQRKGQVLRAFFERVKMSRKKLKKVVDKRNST